MSTRANFAPIDIMELSQLDIAAGGAVITAINANQALPKSDLASQQPNDMDYRRAIMMADKYKPISGKKGRREELVAGPLLCCLCAAGYAHPIPTAP